MKVDSNSRKKTQTMNKLFLVEFLFNNILIQDLIHREENKMSENPELCHTQNHNNFPVTSFHLSILDDVGIHLNNHTDNWYFILDRY